MVICYSSNRYLTEWLQSVFHRKLMNTVGNVCHVRKMKGRKRNSTAGGSESISSFLLLEEKQWGRSLPTCDLLSHCPKCHPIVRGHLGSPFFFSYLWTVCEHRPEQMTPASSLCLQSCCSQPWEGQFHTWDSFPVQFISSSQMGPDPCPK